MKNIQGRKKPTSEEDQTKKEETAISTLGRVLCKFAKKIKKRQIALVPACFAMEAIDKEEGKAEISNSVFPTYRITPTLMEKKYPTSTYYSFFLFFCIALESPAAAAASISTWPSFPVPSLIPGAAAANPT